MPQIIVDRLVKTFRVSERTAGLWGAVRGLVRRQHRTVRALDGISFALDAGELVGYIGPNGAGKSTTVKTLAGILVPDSGRCEVLGRVPWRERIAHVSRIGVVFGQRTQLWWDLPVMESFELLRDIYRVPNEKYHAARDELIALLDLEPLLDVPVRQLSLGQRMRCDLAAALLHAPPILFLDEPTIGLDAVSKLAVRDFVKRLNRERGVTVILTTHDMDDIEALCTRVIVIGDGRILSDGTLSELRSRVTRERWLTVDLVEPSEADSRSRRDGHPAGWTPRLPGIRSAAGVARRADSPRDERPRHSRSVRREPADRDDRRASLWPFDAGPLAYGGITFVTTAKPPPLRRDRQRPVSDAAAVPRGGAGRTLDADLLRRRALGNLRGVLPLHHASAADDLSRNRELCLAWAGAAGDAAVERRCRRPRNGSKRRRGIRALPTDGPVQPVVRAGARMADRADCAARRAAVSVRIDRFAVDWPRRVAARRSALSRVRSRFQRRARVRAPPRLRVDHAHQHQSALDGQRRRRCHPDGHPRERSFPA